MNVHLYEEIERNIDVMKWGQVPEEYKAFMEFATSYFRSRGILNPVVVEIGIWNGYQSAFFREIMGAEHIGIDVSDENAKPTILGDSLEESTYEELTKALKGRRIDLLFIDGNHSYLGVKHDYEKYGALTQHIIVVHDINSLLVETDSEPIDVMRFWKELQETNKTDTLISIQHWNEKQFYGRQMGIGVIVKGESK